MKSFEKRHSAWPIKILQADLFLEVFLAILSAAIFGIQNEARLEFVTNLKFYSSKTRQIGIVCYYIICAIMAYW